MHKTQKIRSCRYVDAVSHCHKVHIQLVCSHNMANSTSFAVLFDIDLLWTRARRRFDTLSDNADGADDRQQLASMKQRPYENLACITRFDHHGEYPLLDRVVNMTGEHATREISVANVARSQSKVVDKAFNDGGERRWQRIVHLIPSLHFATTIVCQGIYIVVFIDLNVRSWVKIYVLMCSC